MKYQTIGDVFAGNEKVRGKFKDVISSLTDEQTSKSIPGEKWTIAQIAEHVSIVDDGIARICGKLLAKAGDDGIRSDGRIELSTDFQMKSDEIGRVKIEAPARVHPTSEGAPIAESVAKMDESSVLFEHLRPLFEKYDCSKHKFPHPFFGDLSAIEWLVLVGGHEARHLKQIQNLLEKI